MNINNISVNYSLDLLYSDHISKGGAVIGLDEDTKDLIVCPQKNIAYIGEPAIESGILPSMITVIASGEPCLVLTDGVLYEKSKDILSEKNRKAKAIDFDAPECSDGFNVFYTIQKRFKENPVTSRKEIESYISDQFNIIFGRPSEYPVEADIYKGLVLLLLMEGRASELSFGSILHCLKEEQYHLGYFGIICQYLENGFFFDCMEQYLFQNDRDQYVTLEYMINKLEPICCNPFLNSNPDINNCDVLFFINSNTQQTVSNLILQAYFYQVGHSHSTPYLFTNVEMDSFLYSKRGSYYLVTAAINENSNYKDFDIIVHFKKSDNCRASIRISTQVYQNSKFYPIQAKYDTEMISFKKMILFELAKVNKKKNFVKKNNLQLFDLKAFSLQIVSRNKTHVLSQSISDRLIDFNLEMGISNERIVYDIYDLYIWNYQDKEVVIKLISILAEETSIRFDDDSTPWKVSFSGLNRKKHALQLARIIALYFGKCIIYGHNLKISSNLIN